jgi:hypothetical protein
LKSVDGGASWSADHTGLDLETVRALAIDPQTPTTVFAGIRAETRDHDGREWRTLVRSWPLIPAYMPERWPRPLRETGLRRSLPSERRSTPAA